MKKLLAGVLLSASVLGVCVLGGTAFAAIDEQDTEVGIGFTGHSPGTSGDLEFKWRPDKFDFGNANTINTIATDFPEDSGSNKYVIISDDRVAAITNEWKVTVKMSKLMSGSAQLSGAVLNFDAEKKAYNGTGAEAPEAAGMISAATAAHTATVTATQSLPQDGAAVVAMTDSGAAGSYKGMTAMELSNIELAVPANIAQSGKQYTGKVTWSLDDAI